MILLVDPFANERDMYAEFLHIETHIRTAAHEAGCDAFLMIPYPPDQLVAEVRRLAEASQRTTSRFIPCCERESARGAS